MASSVSGLTSQPSKPSRDVTGRDAHQLSLPGDKSVAHRALLLAGLADGPSEVVNLPEGDDVLRTVAVLQALGVHLTHAASTARLTPAAWFSPAHALDCGNSGTLARLLLGALAGHGVEATLVGDASLSMRPMRRVTAPLAALLGTDVVELTDAGTLPARVRQLARPRRGPVSVATGTPSAQVKSALLLAARQLHGEVRITEATATRDHTERMLAALGVDITLRPGEVVMRGPMRWPGFGVTLPGDPSSAAFLVVAAVASGRALVFEDLLLNRRRLGFFHAAESMGVRWALQVTQQRLGEDVGRICVARPVSLAGAAVDPALVVDLIDEVPALVALALLAQGPTHVPGLGELRLKESDRVARLVDLAAAFGGRASTKDDGLVIEAPAAARGRVAVRTDGDHRIAMAAHVLARVLDVDLHLDAPGCERTSFPSFLGILDGVLRAP